MDLRSIYPETNHKDTLLKAEKILDNLLVRTNFALKTRTALGWRGLHPSVRNGNGWTCKIRGNEGIYGIYHNSTEDSDDSYRMSYKLSYFPLPEEETRMLFATETALLPSQPEYMDYIRNFMCYPGFTKLFHIAEIHIDIQKDNRDILIVSLNSKSRIRTFTKEGIYNYYNDEKICLVEPGGIDQDLPAFNLAFPFFEVLASTLTYNLSDAPVEVFHTNDILNFVNPHKDLNLTLVYKNGYVHTDIIHQYNNEENVVWNSEKEEHEPFSDASWWTSHLSLGSKHSDNKPKAIDRPQLIILTGFLGSGKTTFLKHFIEYHTQNNRFVAVIQNEIGQKGLDASVLEDNFGVVEMDEGCVCCSLVGQLRKGIQQIQESYNPDVIILETTGLANPFNLLEELEQVKDLVRFDSITTVIDALNIHKFIKETHIASEQIKAADILLINKTDLISDSQLEQLLADINEINNNALVLESVKGDINPALIYVADKDEIDIVPPPHVHGNHMHEHLGSIKVDVTSKPKRSEFNAFAENLPDGIFRAKGRIEFSDSDSSYIFQYVNGRYDLEEVTNPMSHENYIVIIGKNEAIKTTDTSVFK